MTSKISTLVSFLFYVGIGFSSTVFAEVNDDLIQLAKSKNAQMVQLHKKYSKSLVSVRTNPNYNKYFETLNKAIKKTALKKINKQSLRVFNKHKMDEMCVIANIGGKGPEIARIIGNSIAPPSELGKDESGAPFFKPSFHLKNKEVRVQEPYLSADSLRWVVAYTTPIVLKNGDIPAFIHYEQNWEEYLKVLFKRIQNKGVRIIIVDRHGLIMGDSGKKIRFSKRKSDPTGEKEEPLDYFQPLYLPFSDYKEQILSGNQGSGVVKIAGKTQQFVSFPMSHFGMTLILVK